MRPIRYRVGDATDPFSLVENERRFIVHVCNDRGAWGAGFVMALSRRWDEPEAHYRAWREGEPNVSATGPFTLGEIQIVVLDQATAVVNMIAQRGFPAIDRPCALDYPALERCLTKLATQAAGLSGLGAVHMPRIGCGIAGGTWADIEPVIERTLLVRDIPVTVYDLPA